MILYLLMAVYTIRVYILSCRMSLTVSPYSDIPNVFSGLAREVKSENEFTEDRNLWEDCHRKATHYICKTAEAGLTSQTQLSVSGSQRKINSVIWCLRCGFGPSPVTNWWLRCNLSAPTTFLTNRLLVLYYFIRSYSHVSSAVRYKKRVFELTK